MKKIFNWLNLNKKSVLQILYMIPILFSIIVSINHVIVWYEIANPVAWAVFLSIGVEIAAILTLVAMIFGESGWHIYMLFIFVIIIQLVGNIFFSYFYIDINSDSFKAWSELINVIFDDNFNLTKLRVWLAMFEGSSAPILALLSLHLLVKFEIKKDRINDNIDSNIINNNNRPIPDIEHEDNNIGEVYNNDVNNSDVNNSDNIKPFIKSSINNKNNYLKNMLNRQFNIKPNSSKN